MRKPELGAKPASKLAVSVKTLGLSWLVVAFLITLAIPWIVSLGPLRLTVYRLLLLIVTVPCLWMWAAGYAGRLRFADAFILLFALWGTCSLFLETDVAIATQPVGVLWIETLGPYFLARVFIRSADQFAAMAKVLFAIVSVLLPLAVLEAVTGHKVLLELFGIFMPTYGLELMEPRAGLWRVQGPFEHPILFGAFCSSAFSLVFLVLGYKVPMVARWMRTGIVAAATLLSLSAGPFLSLVVAGALITGKKLWDKVGTHALVLIMTPLLLLALTAQVFGPRSLIEILVTKLTFDNMSYWSRSLIWDFAWRSVMTHPWFGVGLDPWARPAWLHVSIDNFWLFSAVRYGIPAALFMILAVVAAWLTVAIRHGLDERHERYRAAYTIAMIGLCLTGMTVHFWDATHTLFMFLLGSGVWIADIEGDTPSRRMTATSDTRRDPELT